RRTVCQRPPEVLDETPQPSNIHPQGRRHGIGPNPAGAPRQPVGAEQVGQAPPRFVAEAAQRYRGDRRIRRAHPAGELVPQDVEFWALRPDHGATTSAPIGAAMRRRPFHTKRLDTVEPSLPPPCNWWIAMPSSVE